MTTHRRRWKHRHATAAWISELSIKGLLALAVSTWVILVLSCAVPCLASPPEIANIYPDFPGSGDAPKIITGEGFDPASTRIWTWSPPSDEATIKQALADIDKDMPPLPAKPPEGARRHNPIDVEPQVIVAGARGSVMWVETADGFSKPLVFNVSKPCWLSESKATPGSMVYVFGFGLKAPYAKITIAITGSGGTFFPPRIVEARALRTADSRLVYFEVPKEIKPGQYGVYLHNSIGGKWGWRKAGDLEAVAPVPPKQIFDVRTFGAKGDGLANDRAAIVAAIAAAHQAGGGTVFLPPGTYLVDETVDVLDGVTLRGASRANCILEGFGDPSQSTNKIWYIPLAAPSAVLQLHGNTSLESLTLRGATWKGKGGDSLIRVKTDRVENVTIVDCCLRADEEDPRSRRELYRAVMWVEDRSSRIKVLSNEIFGALSFSNTSRADIIGNTFHGGAASDVVTLGGRFSQSLFDANRLVDTPGRICVGTGWHNYFRFNEIHQAFRSTWENAEEMYLVHGGVTTSKTIGFATGGAADTLVDTLQDWKPDFYVNATVMVISGRGFGQYRRVVGSTKDTLTLEKPWNVEPDSTTEYLVSRLFTENAFFANLNNTPCRLSLWLDCVANVVEMHRDDHSKGSDVWGEDSSVVDEEGIAKDITRFYPAYYNMFVNQWMDGTALWLGVKGANPDNAHKGYPIFGNFAVGNRIRQPHVSRTGFHHQVPRDTPGISINGGSGRAGASHTVVTNNFFGSTYTGVRVNPMARKTILLRNEFDHVDEPIDDRGLKTIVKGNWLTGDRGSRGDAIPDARSERDLPPWQPRPWKRAPAEEASP